MFNSVDTMYVCLVKMLLDVSSWCVAVETVMLLLVLLLLLIIMIMMIVIIANVLCAQLQLAIVL